MLDGWMVKVLTCVTLMMSMHPGLPLTTVHKSLFNALNFSFECSAVGSGLEMLMFVFRIIFQCLAAKCFLEAPCLAILLDLQQTGST